MADTKVIDNLIDFGLTRQEASIYVALLNHGEMTGYEVAKDTGISRSNVYAALNALTEKGGAYLVEGESTKYHPVEIKRFTGNRIRELEKSAEWLEKHSPRKIIPMDGYITITGAKNIRNKIYEMLEKTELRLYIMAPAAILEEFEGELRRLIGEGKKVVLLTKDYSLDGAILYKVKPEESQLRFITDSAYVLTGELTDDEHDTCLYSGQKNLVSVMKEALKNQITLLSEK
ncbi:MAG: hypothetical protein K5829_06790 [Treponema sp.]|nr:hypothetical protein [Treponema sp.]